MQICILGATGLVGRECLTLIARAWPGATLHLYASRDQQMEHGGKTYEVLGAERLEQDDAPRGDLAMVALDDEHSKRFVPRLLALGYRVIDKSNTYRGDPAVPLVAAGVNTARIDDTVKLVANPNCTTIPLMMTLAPLEREFGLETIAVSTYQAVSGAGLASLDQFLENSRIGYQVVDRTGSQFEPSGYAGNTVPHNGGTDDSGYSAEERKLMFESRKILERPELSISVQCCRVSVAVGHYENVWVTFKQPVTLDAVAGVLTDATRTRFVCYVPGATGEGLTAVATVQNRDSTLAGRLRYDLRDKSLRSVGLTVAGDNLRLGAATNAVRLASRWFGARDPQLQA
jgi:aspartate-semialdehyde dehydrogenase